MKMRATSIDFQDPNVWSLSSKLERVKQQWLMIHFVNWLIIQLKLSENLNI